MTIGRDKDVSKLKDVCRDTDKTTDKTNGKQDQQTERGGWWKDTIKDTPIPGTYHIRDFIEEATLNPVRVTYGFRGTGRNGQTARVRKGDVLLPGAYDFLDSTQQALQKQASWAFKNRPRPDNYTLGIRDKRDGPAPGQYEVKTPQSSTPGISSCFRSTVPRLHSVRSRTPGPGTYEPSWQPGQHLATEADMGRNQGVFFRNVF
ncbi:protein STPG4 isoform X2 [Alosa sapidissima]|uniref:protein STPG4 isoform X2 n=1 Tax=Alosa sapidissima TaxID=34773 RepID=UPI001C08E146|nr:protein STPG4 isoform X2 [Alosa sapidissima]